MKQRTPLIREHTFSRNSARLVAAISAILTALATLAAPAHAQVAYTFSKDADSARDNFDPNSFTCVQFLRMGTP